MSGIPLIGSSTVSAATAAARSRERPVTIPAIAQLRDEFVTTLFSAPPGGGDEPAMTRLYSAFAQYRALQLSGRP